MIKKCGEKFRLSHGKNRRKFRVFMRNSVLTGKNRFSCGEKKFELMYGENKKFFVR